MLNRINDRLDKRGIYFFYFEHYLKLLSVKPSFALAIIMLQLTVYLLFLAVIRLLFFKDR